MIVALQYVCSATFTSTTGVPSTTSIGPIKSRLPETSRTVTRCNPKGSACERGRGVATRVRLKHLAIRQMQPRDHDDLVTRHDP